MNGIMIAVPTYSQEIHAMCAGSLVTNISNLNNAGYSTELKIEAGNCYLAKARSSLTHFFMQSNYDYLIFVDADLCFDGNAMLKLINHKVDFVGGVYPYKNQPAFPATVNVDENHRPVIENSGLIDALFIPTGLMCLHRSVFEKMYKKEWVEASTGICMFFDEGFLWPERVWYGEDVAFCKRWKEIGGQIWLDPSISFDHWGLMPKHGNYLQYIEEYFKEKT